MLSANYSDFTSASSFLLCVCCPQNSAILHQSIICFFAYIVRKMLPNFICHKFLSLPILYAKCSDIYLSVVSLFVYCPHELKSSIFQLNCCFVLRVFCPQKLTIYQRVSNFFMLYVSVKTSIVQLECSFFFEYVVRSLCMLSE